MTLADRKVTARNRNLASPRFPLELLFRDLCWSLLDAGLAVCAKPELTQPAQPQTGTFILDHCVRTAFQSVSKIFFYLDANHLVAAYPAHGPAHSGRVTH